jgi:hypothetical protein
MNIWNNWIFKFQITNLFMSPNLHWNYFRIFYDHQIMIHGILNFFLIQLYQHTKSVTKIGKMATNFVVSGNLTIQLEWLKTSNSRKLPNSILKIQFHSFLFFAINHSNWSITILKPNYLNWFCHFQIPIFNSPNRSIAIDSRNWMYFKYQNIL